MRRRVPDLETRAGTGTKGKLADRSNARKGSPLLGCKDFHNLENRPRLHLDPGPTHPIHSAEVTGRRLPIGGLFLVAIAICPTISPIAHLQARRERQFV